MNRPKCKTDQTTVVDSRQQGDVRRRRYRCQLCGLRFNTVEQYAAVKGK